MLNYCSRDRFQGVTQKFGDDVLKELEKNLTALVLRQCTKSIPDAQSAVRPLVGSRDKSPGGVH